MSETIEFHDLANIFPLLEGVTFRDLVEDIRVHGLKEPIVLFEGAILDGRNRYRACRAAQVAARFKTYDGRDPLAFVVSANLHRRHLDASQRALIAAQIASPDGKRGPPKSDGRRDSKGRLVNYQLKHPDRKTDGGGTQRNAAPFVKQHGMRVSAERAGELLNVSGTSVRHAHRVLTAGVSELIEAVRSGETSVLPASEIARLPREQQSAIIASGPKVSVLGRQTRQERLDERRVERAAKGESAVAVFDHLKVGDGRPIGNVRLGEIERMATHLLLVAKVLLAVRGHFANPDDAARVRDAVNERTLSDLINKAEQSAESEVA